MPEINVGCLSHHFPTLGFEAGSLSEPEQPFLARLAGQHAPGICLSLPHRTGPGIAWILNYNILVGEVVSHCGFDLYFLNEQ